MTAILTYEDVQIVVPQIARTWLGTPYHQNTCMKGKGVDCARFLTAIFQEAGLIPLSYQPPPEHRDWIHGKDVDTKQFMRDLLRFGHRVKFDERVPGDVISFTYNGVESHVGVLVENDHIIHACNVSEVMEHPLRAFLSCIEFTYRINL